MAGATLDAGALIAVERGDPYVGALIEAAVDSGAMLAVPAGVLGQVWRGSPRQARLARLLGLAEVEEVPLDGALARAAGALCARTGTRDVIDASVVLCARERRHAVVTSDPADIEALDPNVRVIVV